MCHCWINFCLDSITPAAIASIAATSANPYPQGYLIISLVNWSTGSDSPGCPQETNAWRDFPYLVENTKNLLPVHPKRSSMWFLWRAVTGLEDKSLRNTGIGCATSFLTVLKGLHCLLIATQQREARIGLLCQTFRKCIFHWRIAFPTHEGAHSKTRLSI